MGSADSNNRYKSMAVTDDASLTPTGLLVDPVTGYLLITVYTGTLGGIAPTLDTVDANNRDVALAVTDDASADIRPLAMTTEGYLLVDIA